MMIQLSTGATSPTELPQGQAQTLQLLRELAETGQRFSLQDLTQRSNLASPLPILSRLRHLEERGLIQISPPLSQHPSRLSQA